MPTLRELAEARKAAANAAKTPVIQDPDPKVVEAATPARVDECPPEFKAATEAAVAERMAATATADAKLTGKPKSTRTASVSTKATPGPAAASGPIIDAELLHRLSDVVQALEAESLRGVIEITVGGMKLSAVYGESR